MSPTGGSKNVPRLDGSKLEKMMDYLNGNLLIAIPAMADTNFSRTVVMILKHSEEGASGVVINRPSEVAIVDAWKEISDLPCRLDGMLFIGGPVQGPLIALHTNPEVSEASVTEGVFASMGSESINELVSHADGRVKLVSGYSGWGPNQLESEIEQGGWLTLKATADLIFDSPDGLWKQVCQTVGNDIMKSQFGNVRSDPSLN